MLVDSFDSLPVGDIARQTVPQYLSNTLQLCNHLFRFFCWF